MDKLDEDLHSYLTEKLRKLVMKMPKLMALDVKIRGEFLVQAILVEQFITDIITLHFGDNERQRALMTAVILNGADVTFAKKIKILEKLLELEHPNVLKEYPELFEQLGKVRDFRNKLAHAAPFYPDKLLSGPRNDMIALSFFKGGRRVHQNITRSEMKSRTRDNWRIIGQLVGIYNSLGGKGYEMFSP